jgi:hypothetical protein
MTADENQRVLWLTVFRKNKTASFTLVVVRKSRWHTVTILLSLMICDHLFVACLDPTRPDRGHAPSHPTCGGDIIGGPEEIDTLTTRCNWMLWLRGFKHFTQ